MIYLIPTPIGNIDDISLRSLKLLSEIEILLCEDTRVTKKLLNLLSSRHDIDFKIEQFIPFHSHNDTKVLNSLDAEFLKKQIAFVSDAGMPCVSDPGAKLIKFARERGLDYEVLPGASAAILSYASSGFDNPRFLFYGFLPHKGKERANSLEYVLNSEVPVVLYESPHRIEKFADELENMEPNREIFAVKEATKRFEKKFFGTAVEFNRFIKSVNTKGEWSLVISPADSQGGTPISKDDIEKLDINPKTKAKLLAKLTGRSVKECYETLIK